MKCPYCNNGWMEEGRTNYGLKCGRCGRVATRHEIANAGAERDRAKNTHDENQALRQFDDLRRGCGCLVLLLLVASIVWGVRRFLL